MHGATAMDGFARAGQRRDVVLTRRTTVPHELVAHQLVVIPWPDAVSGRAQTRSLGSPRVDGEDIPPVSVSIHSRSFVGVDIPMIAILSPPTTPSTRAE